MELAASYQDKKTQIAGKRAKRYQKEKHLIAERYDKSEKLLGQAAAQIKSTANKVKHLDKSRKHRMNFSGS